MPRPKFVPHVPPHVKQADLDKRMLQIDEEPKHKNGKLDHPAPRISDSEADYNIGG